MGIDARVGRSVRTQFTKEPVKVIAAIPGKHANVFAGLGSSLVQYETRALGAGKIDSKSKAVGMWTLPNKVFALDCVRSVAGNMLVAVGCQDGSVAAFDTS